MLTRENVLKCLKKYGYNSKTVHPYLYQSDRNIGIVYSYIDEQYGILERIKTFNNILDLETFLKKFQWFKLNGKQNNVSMKLNNYEIKEPEVIFIRNNHVMTDEEIFNLDAYDKRKVKERKLTHTKRLLAEVNNLLDHYYIHKNDIEKYVNNVNNKESELKRYYIDLQGFINQYNRQKADIIDELTIKTFKIDDDLEDKINVSLAQAKNNSLKEPEVYNLLSLVWQLNKDLELNKDYLEAIKANDGLDEEMRLTVTKIDFMKELLSKKRHWFTPLVNLNKKFQNIDASSTFKSVYDDHFEEKYQDFVNKKYAVLEQVNEFRLCEYLDDFTGSKEYDIQKNINRCKDDLKIKNEENFVEFNQIIDNLTKQFNTNINNDEKSALILYSSIYKNLFEIIMGINNYESISIGKLNNLLNITEGFQTIYENSYDDIKRLLKMDCNSHLKKTVFKNIDFSDKEKFIDSIRKNIVILANINEKIILKDNIHLYFATSDLNDLEKKKFIKTTSTITPYLLKKNNNYRVICADVKKGTNVLFAPNYLKLPAANAFNQNIELIEEPNPDIIIDSNDILINKDLESIVLSKHRSNIISADSYNYADNLVENYQLNVNKVIIEKRNCDE